jgi:hypothetical protein
MHPDVVMQMVRSRRNAALARIARSVPRPR